MNDPNRFCNALDEWAGLMFKAKEVAHPAGAAEFQRQWREIRLMISKSCLLDRVIYGGEKPSKTPCPVHNGRWIGCHFGWPGTKLANGDPVQEDPMLRKWYDAGCRCFMHGCGCTTGWQPDEHCGCGVKP